MPRHLPPSSWEARWLIPMLRSVSYSAGSPRAYPLAPQSGQYQYVIMRRLSGRSGGSGSASEGTEEPDARAVQ
jgi:hypothetical protein